MCAVARRGVRNRTVWPVRFGDFRALCGVWHAGTSVDMGNGTARAPPLGSNEPSPSPMEAPSNPTSVLTRPIQSGSSGGGEGMDRRAKKRRLTTKRIAMVVGGLALHALVVWGLFFQDTRRTLNVERDKITVATIDRGTFQEYVSVTGAAQPIKTVYLDAVVGGQVEERYVVAAPVSGFAQRVTHEVGDAVQAGEVLAVLEPVPTTPLDARTQAELRARVQAAEAAMRSAAAQAAAARSQATLAAATRDRMRPLAADSILAAVELDRYEAEARQAADAQAAAEAAVEATRQELRAVRALLQSSAGARGGGAVAVRAPAGGAVLAVHHESEGVVAAGQPLVEVGDPSALEVVADVLSEEATRLAPAMRALVESFGQTAEGRVREVEPVSFTDVSALGVAWSEN